MEYQPDCSHLFSKQYSAIGLHTRSFHQDRFSLRQSRLNLYEFGPVQLRLYHCIIVNNNITIAVIRHNQSVSPPNLSHMADSIRYWCKYPVGSGHYTRFRKRFRIWSKRTRYTSTACIHPDNSLRSAVDDIQISCFMIQHKMIRNIIIDSWYWKNQCIDSLFHPYDLNHPVHAGSQNHNAWCNGWNHQKPENIFGIGSNTHGIRTLMQHIYMRSVSAIRNTIHHWITVPQCWSTEMSSVVIVIQRSCSAGKIGVLTKSECCWQTHKMPCITIFLYNDCCEASPAWYTVTVLPPCSLFRHSSPTIRYWTELDENPDRVALPPDPRIPQLLWKKEFLINNHQ